jgi:hypothetical protein
MKAPRPKPHLIFSPYPLANNQDTEALCKRKVPKAYFIKEVIAEPGMSIKRSQLPGVCADCWNAEWPNERYVYLMIDGEAGLRERTELL